MSSRGGVCVFVHSSDIMMPCHEGPTASQLAVTSRILDTERWRKKQKLYWHKLMSAKKYGNILSTAEKKSSDTKYIKFLESMERSGFNPSLSHLQMAQLPILGQNDGTHRLGYLLSVKENIFVPVKIMPLPQGLWFPINGTAFLLEKGVSLADMNILLDRYYELQKKLRRYVIGIIKKDVMSQKETMIFAEIAKVGRCIKTKCVSLNNIDTDKWSELKNISDNDCVLLNIELYYQIMNCQNGHIKSIVVDNLSKNLTNLLGGNWGYIAGTVTESVSLEKDMYA